MAAETVSLGSIVKTVGLRGEVKLLPGPDFWIEALAAHFLDLVSGEGDHRQVSVDHCRNKGTTYILKLSGIESIDEAKSIVGDSLEVDLEDLDEDLCPDRLLPFQAEGLEVRTTDGATVGVVVEMLLGPVQDCLIIEDKGERMIVPNVPEVVSEIDLEGGFIVIDPPDGLLDLRW